MSRGQTSVRLRLELAVVLVPVALVHGTRIPAGEILTCAHESEDGVARV